MATGTARHNGPVSKAIAELEISTRKARFDAFRATLLKILSGQFPGSGSGQTGVLPFVSRTGESSDAGQNQRLDLNMNDIQELIGSDEQIRLFDTPDWMYLLREFDTLYRHGSAGGSKLIRAHRKRVRDTLSKTVESNPPVAHREPQTKPVTAHLPRALDLGERGAVSGMARALARVASALTWEYGYTKVPKTLVQKYAYCEVLGPRGPVLSERLVLGFVLFAPRTTYPQHSHHDIEESYISIAGAWSENDVAVHAPGSLILNRPGEEHRITTANIDPCLLAYAWTGPETRLHRPDMKLTSPRKARITQGI